MAREGARTIRRRGGAQGAGDLDRPARTGRCIATRAARSGLATSGSGDTLAGIVAGLAARGASAAHAAVWGVYLHGAAGQALARRLGPIGYLARELLDEVPGVMRRMS